MNFEWQNKHWYMLSVAATIISFIFFADEKVIVPKWGLLFAFLTLFMIAMGESWEAWKRKGMIINTTLGVGKGSATGINPVGDIRIARSKDAKSANMAVIATGGFVFAGFSVNGKDDFLVCPPAHVMQLGSNIIVKTKFRKVKYTQLPPHVQSELLQLPNFKESTANKHNNLWFGLTSSYYGSDTIDNLKAEQEALAKLDQSNEYSAMLRDIIEQKENVGLFNRKRNVRRDYEIVDTRELSQERQQ